MPDRDGRFSMNDGLSIANVVTTIQNNQAQQQERLEKRIKDEKLSNYMNMIGRGEAPDRNADDFDYGMYLDASAKQMQHLLNDQQYQQNLMILDEKRRDQSETDMNNRIIRAETLKNAGQVEQAMQVLAPVYNYFPDGNKFVGFSENGTMILEGPGGKQFEQPAPPLDHALAQAKQFSQSFRQVDQEFQNNRRKWNAEAIKNKQIHQSPDGKVKAFYIAFMDKDGSIRETWKDAKTGKTLKGFDQNSGKNVESNLELYPMETLEKGLDIEGKGIANQQARVVDPNKIVTGGDGRQGVVQMNPGGQGLSLNPVEGGIKEPPAKAPSVTDQNAMKNQEVKDLNAVLMPLAEKGGTVIDFETGELTQSGKNALDSALKLIEKHKNLEPLTASEQRKLKPAYQAWQMYEKIANSRAAGAYAGGGGWRQWAQPQSQQQPNQ